MVNETKQEDNWTYIRIRKSTAKKLRAIKLEQDIEVYDEVIDSLLSKYNLSKK
jgi:hypothetical protein